MEAFVKVQGEVVMTRTSTRKPKTQKGVPLLLGLHDITHRTAWLSLLTLVADMTKLSQENLAVDSLTWQWMKAGPGKGGSLPLTSEAGFSQIQITAKSTASPVVVISMPYPQPKRQVPVKLLRFLCVICFADLVAFL